MLAAFDQARLEANTLTIPMYIETTRTFIQLATGLLTVTILFREKVLHETRRTAISTPLALSWLSLLLSVGAGAIIGP